MSPRTVRGSHTIMSPRTANQPHTIANYFQLTKPTIIILVAITGLAMMSADGSIFAQPLKMTIVLCAIIFSAASANALNQIIDQDIDSIMERTRTRRPLPQGKMSKAKALAFALTLGIFSNLYLWFNVNPLSAILSIATILFYIFIYTLWLKRRHHYNIVIGGAAGATAPLIASAASSGTITPYAWIMFAIIFMWTPAHFWALALAVKDEYAKVKVPMLPNVLGIRALVSKSIFILLHCCLFHWCRSTRARLLGFTVSRRFYFGPGISKPPL